MSTQFENGEPNLLLRIPEAASALACGRSTLYELISKGELETLKLGRSIRIPASSLKEFVERRLAEQGVTYSPGPETPAIGHTSS